jgi:hypothetical protein
MLRSSPFIRQLRYQTVFAKKSAAYLPVKFIARQQSLLVFYSIPSGKTMNE